MKYLLLSALLALAGCGGGLGPRDNSADTPLRDRAQLRNLPGRWQATAATYELLRRRGYHPHDLPLLLRADSTFAFAGLPDCLNGPYGSPGSGQLLGATGKWQVRSRLGRWEADLNFKKGKLFPTGLATNYAVAVVDSTYQLYTFIGDPDEAQMLMWTKPIAGPARVK